MSAAYWDMRFGSADGASHHHMQNYQISRDFLSLIALNAGPIRQALHSDSIIEIGCGNGALAAMISRNCATPTYYATDLSEKAVLDARRRSPEVRFEKFDILEDWPTLLGTFKLAIASNVLEHFRDPWLVLDRMLVLAEQALVLVPYRQGLTDGYDAEGGAGHVYRFTRKSFQDYNVQQTFLFKSDGWVHRAKGDPKPMQLVVLVGRS